MFSLIPKKCISKTIKFKDLMEFVNNEYDSVYVDRLEEVHHSINNMKDVYIIDAFTMMHIIMHSDYSGIDMFKYMFLQDTLCNTHSLLSNNINNINAFQIFCAFEYYDSVKDLPSFINKAKNTTDIMRKNKINSYLTYTIDNIVYTCMSLAKYKVTQFGYIVRNLSAFCNTDNNLFMFMDFWSSNPTFKDDKNVFDILSLVPGMIVLLSFNPNLHKSIIKKYNISFERPDELLFKMYNSICMEDLSLNQMNGINMSVHFPNKVALSGELMEYQRYCINDYFKKLEFNSNEANIRLNSYNRDSLKFIKYFHKIANNGSLFKNNLKLISSISIASVLRIIKDIDLINSEICIYALRCEFKEKYTTILSDFYDNNKYKLIKSLFDKIEDRNLMYILNLIPNNITLTEDVVKSINDIVDKVDENSSIEDVFKSISDKYEIPLSDLLILYNGNFSLMKNLNENINKLKGSMEMLRISIERENKYFKLSEYIPREQIDKISKNTKSIALLIIDKVFKSDYVTLQMAPSTSALHGFAGYITGCCQSYDHDGNDCCERASSRYNAATALFYEHETLKSISYVHYDLNGILVFDTIEHKGDITLSERDTENYFNCIKQYMDHMESEYNLPMHTLSIGTKYGAFRGDACLNKAKDIMNEYNKSNYHYIRNLIHKHMVYNFISSEHYTTLFKYLNNDDVDVNRCSISLNEKLRKGLNGDTKTESYLFNGSYTDINFNIILYVNENVKDKYDCNCIFGTYRKLIHLISMTKTINGLSNNILHYLNPDIRDILKKYTSTPYKIYQFLNILNVDANKLTPKEKEVKDKLIECGDAWDKVPIKVLEEEA